MTPIRRVPAWAWALAIPLVLILLAWGAAHVLLPPARARDIVSQQLAKRLDREVRFAGVSLSIFPPVRLSVHDVEVAEPEGFGRGAAFSAKALDLDLELFALLRRQIRVHRLEIVEPRLHLLLRLDGTTNFDGIAKSEAKEPATQRALDLDVRELRVRNGGLLLDDVRANRRTSLALDTKMDLRYERNGQRIATGGATELSHLAIGPLAATRASQLDHGLEKLRWKIRHRGKFDATTQRMALEQLALEFGGTSVSVSGLIDEVGTRARYDLKATAKDVDLEQLLAWVSVADAQAVKGIHGRGRLAFDLAARGSTIPGTIPSLTGVASVKDAAFRYEGAPAEVSGLSFAANFQPDQVVVPDLRATVSGQPLVGRLQIAQLANPIVEFAIRGKVDLAAVGPMFAPKDTKLAGNAVVDLSGNGRAKDPGTMALAGAAELRGVSVEMAKMPKRIEKVNGRVEFSSQKATVRDMHVHAGPSSYVLDAVVTRPLAALAEPGKVPPAGVTFQFRSPHLDLGDLLPTTPGEPYLPNVTGTGRVDIDRLKQGKLDVSAVHADVNLAPGSLESPGFAMNGYGGRVSGTAHIDLRDTRKPDYSVHAVMDSVKADQVLRTWTPIEGLLAGTLNSTFDFHTAGKTPEEMKNTVTLRGLAEILNGRFGPGPALEEVARFVRVPSFKQLDIGKAVFPLRVENGRVIMDRVTIHGPNDGEYLLAGAVGFDGSLDYAVSMTLPPQAVEALNARSAIAAGALSDDKGRLFLDLRVTGPWKAPRIAWDTQAMAARVAGRASDALAEQRQKVENDAREAARQILLEKIGAKRDSAAATPGEIRDSLKSAAKDLLEGFLGKKKKNAPLPPVTDTTKH
jgi:hypothetical protein